MVLFVNQCECASVCSTSTVHNNYWLNLQLLQIIFEFCTGNFRKMKCPMRNPFASLSFSSIDDKKTLKVESLALGRCDTNTKTY